MVNLRSNFKKRLDFTGKSLASLECKSRIIQLGEDLTLYILIYFLFDDGAQTFNFGP